MLVPEINRDYILSKVSQEEIFERYMGIRVTLGGMVTSPLRDDHNPTCSFKWLSSNLLWFKDWSGHFAGDCFAYVMRLHNCTFFEACDIIAIDFKLISSTTGVVKKDRIPKETSFEVLTKTKIAVKWKSFGKTDIDYWGCHGIPISILNLYKVAPIEYAWVNDRLVYSNRSHDPAYGYWFGPNEMKLYFPLREKYRFLGNATCLQGYEQLPLIGDLLIVTKSLKDVMFLKTLKIPAVAPQSESAILTEEQFKELSRRFAKIVCLYDFDLAGIRSANKMKRLYKIPPKFFTTGRFGTSHCGGKDCTDIVKRFSADVAKKQLDELLKTDKWYIQNIVNDEEAPF